MTNENNNVVTVEEKKECFCQSKGFRKFLIVAGGSFVGVFCALSLFAALHKPPMPPCPFGGYMMRPPVAYHHFDRGHHRDFCKKMERRHFKKLENKDFAKRPPVGVNVENKD